MFFVFLGCMIIENGNGNEVIGLRLFFVFVFWKVCLYKFIYKNRI